MTADRPATAAAAVALSCIGIFGIMAAPILTNILGTGLQLDADQIGQIVSAEIGGGALASILASFWIQRANWRIVGAGAVVSVVVINVLSGLQTDATTLAALRFLGGLLGQGTAFAIAIGIINSSGNPDRIFGFSIAAQVALGVVMLLVLPALGEQFGLRGVLWPLAALAAVVLPMLRWIPAHSGREAELGGAGAAAGAGMAWIALVVLLAWCVGLGAIWAFLLSIGEAGGLAATTAGRAMAISTAVAIAGALAASALAGRGGRLLPVSIALLVQIGAILMLQGEMSFLRFTATCAAFQIFWNFTGPYLMGMVATNDPTGRIAVLIPVAQTGGFAIGPAIAGNLMTGDSLLGANYVGVVGVVVALLIFVPTALRSERTHG